MKLPADFWDEWKTDADENITVLDFALAALVLAFTLAATFAVVLVAYALLAPAP